jgi:hypothetical protein
MVKEWDFEAENKNEFYKVKIQLYFYAFSSVIHGVSLHKTG